MRIAFSGSHRVGKTTLIERIAEHLPDHTVIDEPYYLLEDEGHNFSDPPSLEDFEAQFTRSLAALADAGRNTLFDRCPIDLLAYLLEHPDAPSFDPDDRLDPIRDALSTLDLIVFVPIEPRDRIHLASHDDANHRRAVHDRLHDLLIDQSLDLGVDLDILPVTGDIAARADQVLSHIARCAAPPASK